MGLHTKVTDFKLYGNRILTDQSKSPNLHVKHWYWIFFLGVWIWLLVFV